MSVAMLTAYILIGLLATGLARRGIQPVMLLAAGVGLSLLMLALIATEALSQTHLLWIAYGTFSSFGTLVYSQAPGLFAGGSRFPGSALGSSQYCPEPDGFHRRLWGAMGTRSVDRPATTAGAKSGPGSPQRFSGPARNTIDRLCLVLHCQPPTALSRRGRNRGSESGCFARTPKRNSSVSDTGADRPTVQSAIQGQIGQATLDLGRLL